MTAAAPAVAPAPATELTVRPAPPSPRRDGVPGADGGRPAVAPGTTGMPSWASEPGRPAPAPHDLTQRVSGAAPAESPWGSTAAAPPAAAAPSGPLLRPARSVPPALPSPVAAEQSASAPEPPAEPAARNIAEVPVGGRAAARLERQAAEAARKKSGRRTGPPARPETPAQTGPGRDADAAGEPRRAPRRLVQGLVATVVVAGGVLSYWSFTSPGTQETSAQSPVTSSAPDATAAVPVQQSIAPSSPVAQAPVGPVRAPITVLNSTTINGLAADVGDQFTSGGWEVSGTGKSPVTDVATSTVYYTEGDTVQEQAATQLIEQFPDVTGPVPRYFDVPGTTTPGLVVVVTGNWRP